MNVEESCRHESSFNSGSFNAFSISHLRHQNPRASQSTVVWQLEASRRAPIQAAPVLASAHHVGTEPLSSNEGSLSSLQERKTRKWDIDTAALLRSASKCLNPGWAVMKCLWSVSSGSSICRIPKAPQPVVDQFDGSEISWALPDR